VSHDQWSAVDDYITAALIPADDALDAALVASADAGLPPINVAPNQGRLLYLLARIHGAANVLEIGTLGGYSTIWLARALGPDGRVVTLELEPRHAEVARRNLAVAGVDHLVDIRVGPAMDSLAQLAADGAGPFDFVFVDADKPNNPGYFRWALELSRPGTLIVVDNVVRNGAVAVESDDPAIVGTRRLFEEMSGERRVTATAVQTVGVKGYDGFAIALVEG
jgi:predicted O-methyltransferase YrrM